MIQYLKIEEENITKKSYFTTIFLNVNISTNVEHKLFKFCEVSLNITVEGTVSQIFYLGPSSYFM